MRSYIDDARATIAALGPQASVEVPLGTIGQFCQWLGWPDWLREGTSLSGDGPLPLSVTMADDLIITANLLQYGDVNYLIGRTLRGPRRAVSPTMSLVLRNAPSLGEALRLMAHGFRVGNLHLDASVESVGEDLVFELCPKVQIGCLLDFLGLVATVFVYSAVETFAHDEIGKATVHLTGPTSDWSLQLSDYLRCNLYPGQASNCVILPPEWAEISTMNYDAGLWQVAKERMGASDTAIAASAMVMRISNQVADFLAESGRAPRLEEIAAAAHVSDRTIGRHLTERGTSFQKIVDNERRKRAVEFLNDPSRSIADVAMAVGYSDVSIFSRAFRGWFGIPPSKFRKDLAT